MNDLTSRDRKYLRSKAHHLDPVVFIGKNGFHDGSKVAISNVLDIHELVKVKFIDFKEQRKKIALIISKELGCHIIGEIGNIIILYRYNEKLEKHNYKIANDK